MAGKKAFQPDLALDRAMNLFWERGYAGSSVEDLVQCTGIGRGSLYDTFGNKHALYLAALDRYRVTGGEKLTVLRQQTGSIYEIFHAFFQALVEEAVARPWTHCRPFSACGDGQDGGHHE